MKMPNRKGKRSAYGDASGRFYGPNPTDTSGTGRGGGGVRTPHPNGGEVRAYQGDEVGRMPSQMKRRPVTHTPLQTGNDFSGLGQMPTQVKGDRQRDPVRR